MIYDGNRASTGFSDIPPWIQRYYPGACPFTYTTKALEANTHSGSPSSLLLCQVILTKDLIHPVSLSLTGHDIYFHVLNGTDMSHLPLHHTNSSLFPSFLRTLHKRASISWRFSLTVTTTTTMNLAHFVCESCVLLSH